MRQGGSHGQCISVGYSPVWLAQTGGTVSAVLLNSIWIITKDMSLRDRRLQRAAAPGLCQAEHSILGVGEDGAQEFGHAWNVL